MPEQLDLRALIKASMSETKVTPKVSRTAKPLKVQPRRDQHGRLPQTPNDARINGRVSTMAEVGSESYLRPVEVVDDEGRRTTHLEVEHRPIRINIGARPNPSKRSTRRKLTRADRVFQSGKGCGVGSSRSAYLGIIKAIAAEETGCIVLPEGRKLPIRQKPTTTTDEGYIVGGQHVID